HIRLSCAPPPETPAGRRERYRGALKRKGDGGRGPGEQDGGLFKSSDAAINAKGHGEKNNGRLTPGALAGAPIRSPIGMTKAGSAGSLTKPGSTPCWRRSARPRWKPPRPRRASACWTSVVVR